MIVIEYKVELHPINKTVLDFEAFLNQRGSEGWELATTDLVTTSSTQLLMVFKRRKVPEGEG